MSFVTSFLTGFVFNPTKVNQCFNIGRWCVKTGEKRVSFVCQNRCSRVKLTYREISHFGLPVFIHTHFCKLRFGPRQRNGNQRLDGCG